MKYNFDEIIDRNGTNSIKYDAGKYMEPAFPEDFIPMWIADMDFSCPPEVLEAMKSRIDRKILGYSMVMDQEYFAAVATWMYKRFGWQADVGNMVFAPGVVPALASLIKLLTQEGEGVIIQPPVYGPFLKCINETKRTPVFNQLINNDGYYTVDFEDLENKAKDPANKLFILCSPHNPTGRVWKEEELTKMAQICIDNDVQIISDEIHFDIVRTGVKHIPLEKLFPGRKDIYTCTAPSKTFNMAGNMLSHIFIPNPEVKEKWNEENDQLANPLSIAATYAAYAECEQWVEELNLYLDGNMKYIQETLAERLPKAKFCLPEGTYLAWIDLSATGLTHQEILQKVAMEAAIFLEGGEMFVAGGEGFIRINTACPRSVLEKAITRLCDAFKN